MLVKLNKVSLSSGQDCNQVLDGILNVQAASELKLQVRTTMMYVPRATRWELRHAAGISVRAACKMIR